MCPKTPRVASAGKILCKSTSIVRICRRAHPENIRSSKPPDKSDVRVLVTQLSLGEEVTKVRLELRLDFGRAYQ